MKLTCPCAVPLQEQPYDVDSHWLTNVRRKFDSVSTKCYEPFEEKYAIQLFAICDGASECIHLHYVVNSGARWFKWLERQFNDRKVRPTSASRLSLSRLGQPGRITALVLPSDVMAARHRKGVTAEQYSYEVGRDLRRKENQSAKTETAIHTTAADSRGGGNHQASQREQNRGCETGEHMESGLR
ncbi:hypothetical protein CSKR_109570 [Clonorchis sinensis]|uniref:Uncharacterized protein n=1 Tax=Clonorchis sinensis TaxID=79923 RepID=A0A3R7CSH7_CLOSI|nr:hypothetical protein CSKR_109570 [Clonorchis sinensis]